MNEPINISIITPTWNRENLVFELLQSLSIDRKGYAFGETEVIVVDSSSGTHRDSIQESCEKFDAIYIRGDDSVRKKRNLGIDTARFDYILFIDSDVTVKPGLLNEYAQTYIANADDEGLAGVFGRTEFVGEKNFWWRVIDCTTFLDAFSFAEKYPYVSWCIGNNVSIKRDVLLQVGKFEENLPFKLGGDDLDLTYRITKRGYRIKTNPEATTYHSRETWRRLKAINDRSKRWGSMEYHILKRHSELSKRRLPMTGDVVLFAALVALISAIATNGPLPLIILALWMIVAYLLLFGYFIRKKGKTNPIYWTFGMIFQGKYRLHRMLTSLKHRDMSLLFKGQFFGVEHVKAVYLDSAIKIWLYLAAGFVASVFGMIIGGLF